MKWGAFFATAAIIIVILLFQWPKMKQKPKKDKIALIVLLFIGWGLSMLNLPHIQGPTTLIEAIFTPFSKILD